MVPLCQSNCFDASLPYIQGAYIREPPRTSVVDAAVGRVLCDAHCPTERYTEPPLPSKWPIFSPKDAHCLNSGIKFPMK